MKAKMKGVLGAMKPATQNQACMWSEPDIVGWLDKRGGKFKSWKKRFFVLQGSYLFYFENDFKVQAKNPLGVIPLDASKVDMKNEESGDASRRYTFDICLGKQFLGYSKRDTYVVAAPSHQALEEWVHRIKTAAEARDVLLDQLRKARWRGGDLRRLLANSMGNREMLEYGACNPEGQALMAEFMKVQEGIAKLQEDVVRLESQANHEEGALMRAMVVWDILNQYLTGKSQAGEHSLAQRRITIEKEAVEQLYRMCQMKGNHFQGQDIEYLGKEAREKLRSKVEHSLYLVQERQAKIRSKAPRYSFNLNPNIFEDEGESLQQEFQPDTVASQPAALRFYKNIRAEVLETAEQLKNLKTTALRVAGIEERGEEGIDRVLTSQDNKTSHDNRMVTNSNMLADMMRRRGEPARDFSVEDTAGNQMVEGTTKAWLENQQQEVWTGMESQFAPPQPPQNQPPQNWPQQNQVRGMRPSPESFGPAQSHFLSGGQLSQPPQSQMPAGRPFSQSHLPGMRPTPASFVPSPSQIPYGPAGPGPVSQNNARPMNQPLPMRPSNQPNMAAGSSAQSFLPRGFQQRASSMPQPPAPNWSAQWAAPQSLMPPGNFGQLPPPMMGLNEQNRFMSPGMMLRPPGGMMVNQQQPVVSSPAGGMMVNRQQPGLSSPASQVPPNFPMSRMQAASPLGAAGPQQFMRASSQPFPAKETPEGMASQMQQQMMRTQPGAMPPMQARMPPQMIRQNFPGAPHMAQAQQNVPRPPMLPMPANQQALNRPPGLPPQNFNRPPQYDAAQPRMAATMQFGSPRPFGAGSQRPM